jgi:tetratricopeptide (TPR) repeat protein
MTNRITSVLSAIGIFLVSIGGSHASSYDPFSKIPHPLPGWNEPTECMHTSSSWHDACLVATNTRGLLAIDAGTYDLAIVRFTQLLQMQKSGVGFHNRAVAHFKKGDFARARLDFKAGLKLDARMAPSWALLTWIEMNAGQYKSALECANEALMLRPGQAEYLEMRAEIYTALGKPKLAEEDAKHAQAIRILEAPAAQVAIGTTETK